MRLGGFISYLNKEMQKKKKKIQCMSCFLAHLAAIAAVIASASDPIISYNQTKWILENYYIKINLRQWWASKQPCLLKRKFIWQTFCRKLPPCTCTYCVWSLRGTKGNNKLKGPNLKIIRRTFWELAASLK